ncbi:MAG: PQQ-like beta-propeller repeat protein, partial [Phycisphaerales bacterium]|nr:PQQ-like beta-propeller repeat protein [Phycisphaerales bacterium]
LYCFDEKTGKRHWRYDTQAALWGSPYVVDGKIYLGDEDGIVHILKEGKEMKVIAKNDMGSSVYTTPVAANGVLFVNNRRMLYAIKTGAESKPAAQSKKD